jgi:predicted nucleotide-binding protein
MGRAEFRLGLVAAYFCGECEASLSEWGVSDKQLESLARILSYVRDFAIRKPRSIPTSVFIGHGRCKDWEQVRDHLISLGVEVDEFNVYPNAGIQTVDRLTQMLDSACLAILVMAAEDRQADGSLNPRLNVVHEIGLFQGRLGFHKLIIVKEKRASKFSNIDGLTYIPYSKGRITDTFPDIDRVLVRERVVTPATAGIPATKPKPRISVPSGSARKP